MFKIRLKFDFDGILEELEYRYCNGLTETCVRFSCKNDFGKIRISIIFYHFDKEGVKP